MPKPTCIHITPNIDYLFPSHSATATAITLCGLLIHDLIQSGGAVGTPRNLNPALPVCPKCALHEPMALAIDEAFAGEGWTRADVDRLATAILKRIPNPPPIPTTPTLPTDVDADTSCRDY